MKYVFYLVMLFMVVSGCSQPAEHTDKFSPPERLAELKTKKIKEASGLAASAVNDGMLWTHNDSGNDAEIFLIDEKLDIRLTCVLEGVENRDWEDIAVGPGPDSTKSYVYVGDIGDNDAIYPYKYIYRFEEPVLAGGAENLLITEFDTFTFRLEDKQKDTESLLIDPRTRNLYVISKREQPVHLYELQYPAYESGDTISARDVLSLPFHMIVAVDYNPVNGDILMKNYNHIYYWSNGANGDLINLLKGQPVEVPYKPEPQGESIAWTRDGSGFYTLSEKKGKEKSYLFYYAVKP